MARLTSKNYYSPEMNQEYWSVSQYKDFVKCEAMAMAKLRGEYEPPMTRALLVGSFIDAYFEGTLKRFKEDHPEIFTKKGAFLSDFKKANDMIKQLRKDTIFMQAMSGKKQKIMTAELFGTKWKIKIDSYHEDASIVDLKIVAKYKSLVLFEYDIQGAVYSEVEKIKKERHSRLPFYLAVATKERVMNKDIFHIEDDIIERRLEEMEKRMPHFIEVKEGREDPTYCGECEYCRSVLGAKIRRYSELLEE